jgi:hypothetical protein
MVRIGPESVVAAIAVTGILVLGYIFMTYMAILAVGIMIGTFVVPSVQNDDGLLGRALSSMIKRRTNANDNDGGGEGDDSVEIDFGDTMRRGKSAFGRAASKIGNMIIEELPDDDDDHQKKKRLAADKNRPGRKGILQLAQSASALARKRNEKVASPLAQPKSIIGELFG